MHPKLQTENELTEVFLTTGDLFSQEPLGDLFSQKRADVGPQC